jgi:hypothetical protein
MNQVLLGISLKCLHKESFYAYAWGCYFKRHWGRLIKLSATLPEQGESRYIDRKYKISFSGSDILFLNKS